jgi:tRNA-2-methylthio-N6-dimethylallyladenosine synthase
MQHTQRKSVETKKLYIKTYGCQMNVYDTVRMQDVLRPLGYEAQESAEGADLVILNTCHIREKADEKVYSDLGRVKKEKDKLKKAGKEMLVAVGGCVAQAEGEEVIKRAPHVDMVFGPQSYHQLPELITRAIREQGGVVELDFPAIEKFDNLPVVTESQGVSAHLAVQEGCDKFCTFCVVPYTRGAEYSRRANDIVDEAKRLVELGARDIMLLGQNVNALHAERPDGSVASLADIIADLAKINGLDRIRYITSHPRDMTQELIDIHGSEPKLMPYLHLPIQAGSNEVLRRMNRKHDRDFYLDILTRLRKARPDIAFSGDFIVGFPGETDKDFDDTMSLVAEVQYASAYSFKYSPRPGTPASTDEDQVPEEVKVERLARLQALLSQQALSFNQQWIGKTLPVLFDREGKREGQMMGKSPYLQSVYVNDAMQHAGKMVDVRITDAKMNSLTGVIA